MNDCYGASNDYFFVVRWLSSSGMMMGKLRVSGFDSGSRILVSSYSCGTSSAISEFLQIHDLMSTIKKYVVSQRTAGILNNSQV